MALATNIHDLLYRYECVILPGFGAFITQRQPAHISAETNEFFPPQKSISFNSQLNKNDGLLANYLMETENISYAAALEKINSFVEDLQHVLAGKNPVDLPKLGIFTLNQEEKLQFEPAVSNNYLKEAFGLDSITSNKVSRIEVVSEEEKERIAFTPEKRTSRPYLKYAAVGILALGLSGFTGLNIYSYQINEHNLSEQQKAASQLETQIQQATFIIDPLPAITLNVTKQTGKYHLVAGAFRMEENAEKKVKELKQEGFKARHIGANKYGLHQVVYSSYENRLEALKALRKVKRSSNSAAWLLVQDL